MLRRTPHTAAHRHRSPHTPPRPTTHNVAPRTTHMPPFLLTCPYVHVRRAVAAFHSLRRALQSSGRWWGTFAHGLSFWPARGALLTCSWRFDWGKFGSGRFGLPSGRLNSLEMGEPSGQVGLARRSDSRQRGPSRSWSAPPSRCHGDYRRTDRRCRAHRLHHAPRRPGLYEQTNVYHCASTSLRPDLSTTLRGGTTPSLRHA